jgi:hypothetical protein
MDKYNDKSGDLFDEQNIHVSDHLVIRDVDSGEILVNQQGSIKNYDLGDIDD